MSTVRTASLTKRTVLRTVLWIRVRSDTDPEKIIPDPGSSGSEMNLKADKIWQFFNKNAQKYFKGFYLVIIWNLTHLQEGEYKSKIYIKNIRKNSCRIRNRTGYFMSLTSLKGKVIQLVLTWICWISLLKYVIVNAHVLDSVTLSSIGKVIFVRRSVTLREWSYCICDVRFRYLYLHKDVLSL